MRTTILLSSCLALLACSGSDPTTTKPTTTGASETLGLASASKDCKTAQYDFTVLDSPRGSSTVLTGVNDLGVVEGFEYDVPGFFSAAEPVVFVNGKGSVVDTGSVYVQTGQMNNWGQVAFSYYNQADIENNVWQIATYDLWSKSWQHLSGPSGTVANFAAGINDKGQVTGGSYDPQTVANLHGWVWDGRKYTTLADPPGTNGTCWGNEPLAINDRGEVTGQFTDDNCVSHGWLFKDGSYTQIDPPGDVCGAIANPINNEGTIGVIWAGADCVNQGALWHDGVFTPFDFPSSLGTFQTITGLSDLGVVVGNFSDAQGNSHGFMAVPHQGN